MEVSLGEGGRTHEGCFLFVFIFKCKVKCLDVYFIIELLSQRVIRKNGPEGREG